MYETPIEPKNYMTLWLENFFQNATPVDHLPFGWCVYREGLDWD